MATLLVSWELTKRSSLYFQQLSRERTTLWGSLKWLLCPNVSCPLTGSGPNLALNRGASCQGDTLPYSPQNLGHQAFQSIRPITNQISRPKLETKSSILLLYLSEATLRAITTIACEGKLAISLVKNDGRSKCCTCCNCWLLQEWCEVLCNWHRRLKAPTICNFLRGQPDGRLFCPLYFLSPSLPLSLPNFPGLWMKY